MHVNISTGSSPKGNFIAGFPDTITTRKTKNKLFLSLLFKIFFLLIASLVIENLILDYFLTTQCIFSEGAGC
jgi:hypothetical protein